MKITTRNNGTGPSSCAEYDYYTLKFSFITDLFVPEGKPPWMVVISVGKGPSMRFYRKTKAQAQALAARWITCQHDRTPQPKFNAHGAQVGWWTPTYEAEVIRSASRALLARADELAAAIEKAEKGLQPEA